VKKIIFVVMIVILSIPAFALVKSEDINGDGIKEIIVSPERKDSERNYFILKVVRNGVDIFNHKPKWHASLAGFKIIDIDSRSPGQEILIFESESPSPQGKMGLRFNISFHYAVEVYRWDKEKEKYLSCWKFTTRKMYRADQIDKIMKEVKSERRKLTRVP